MSTTNRHRLAPSPRVRQNATYEAARARVPLLRWYHRIHPTRREWEACKRAAGQVVRFRKWAGARTRKGGLQETWTDEAPDQLLCRLSGIPEGSKREAKLLQLTAETAYHMGSNLNMYPHFDVDIYRQEVA